MSIHRRAAKRDANEPAIRQALEAQGFHVTPVSGSGLPDLVVTYRGPDAFGKPHWYMWFAEIKNPNGKNKATPAQVSFQKAWQGPAIITLRSVEDAQRFALLAMETPQ